MVSPEPSVSWRRTFVSRVSGSLYFSMTIGFSQTGHFTRFPAWSLFATGTCPQEQTSWSEPAGMRIPASFAATRMRIFARVLGSTAHTALNGAEQDGQVISRPTAAAATGTAVRHLHRTVPTGPFE